MWYVVCGMWYVLCVMCDVLCVMWYVKGRFSKGILFWEVKERKWDTVRIGTALDTYHVLIRQGHVTQKAKNKTIKSKEKKKSLFLLFSLNQFIYYLMKDHVIDSDVATHVPFSSSFFFFIFLRPFALVVFVFFEV